MPVQARDMVPVSTNLPSVKRNKKLNLPILIYRHRNIGKFARFFTERTSVTMVFFILFLLNMYLNEIKMGFSVSSFHPEQAHVNIFPVAIAVTILWSEM